MSVDISNVILSLTTDCSCLYSQREVAAKDVQITQRDTQLAQVHEVILF